MIELKDVSFVYGAGEGIESGAAGEIGAKSANGSLSHLSLSITTGEFILLTGGSGCGKTTVLRLINGLIPNFYEGELSGSVSVDGADVSRAELYDTAKTVSTVFQNPRSQFFNVDTDSELAFACENRGMPEAEIRSRIAAVVSELHLEPLLGRSLFNLSGGQKQKIACASVAVTQNKIVLLDEPSANLDARTIDELHALLAKWKDEGKTIVVAEHRISYLWDLADHTVILNDGRIVRELSRAQMDAATDEELHALGLRSHQAGGAAFKSSGAGAGDTGDFLRINNFRYAYGNGHLALDIPAMDIAPAKITAIVGNNGEGKTTFLNCLCGLDRRARGSISFRGRNYKRRQRQKLVFLVMQDVNHQLFSETVLDELLISMKDEDEDAARKILASLDLSEYSERHPMSLSGGQKQRLAVACAIASGRDIMLFDEPTSGLDYLHMLQIGAMLRQLKAMGKTVVVVTHDRELVRDCCDDVLCLKDFNRAENIPER